MEFRRRWQGLLNYCIRIHNTTYIRLVQLNVDAEVKQGCAMTDFLFSCVIDYVMRLATTGVRASMRWKLTTCLEDLVYPDDIALCSSSRVHMQENTTALQDAARTTGLSVNAETTKLLRINIKSDQLISLSHWNSY